MGRKEILNCVLTSTAEYNLNEIPTFYSRSAVLSFFHILKDLFGS